MPGSETSLRIFKNAWFKRFVRRKKINDQALKEAIARIAEGYVDADLGGNVLKQRIARPGQGRSGGYRTIIIFRHGDKAFFVYGFAKSEKENLDKDEITIFKKSAKALLDLSDEQIKKLIENEGLTEVK